MIRPLQALKVEAKKALNDAYDTSKGLVWNEETKTLSLAPRDD